MNLRQVAIFALALLAAPAPSPGQQPAKVYRIGWLHGSPIRAYQANGSDTDPHQCPIQGNPNWQAFVAGLREHGYIQGENLVIECRWAGDGRSVPRPTWPSS